MEVETRGFELSDQDAIYVFTPGGNQIYKNDDFYVVFCISKPHTMELTIYKRSRTLKRTAKEIAYVGVPYSIINNK